VIGRRFRPRAKSELGDVVHHRFGPQFEWDEPDVTSCGKPDGVRTLKPGSSRDWKAASVTIRLGNPASRRTGNGPPRDAVLLVFADCSHERRCGHLVVPR